MALEQRITQKLGQRLVMTPSLQQAIKLLQMSKLELVDEVQQELLENPVLEEQADAGSSSEAADPADGENSTDAEADPMEDFDFSALLNDTEGFTPRPLPEAGAELPAFENTLSEPLDLADRLVWQLDMSAHDEATKAIGRAIIGNLNEDGYLRATPEELQQMGPWPAEPVERTLKLIQGFDPVGVASRDLVECLCIQLEHRGESDTPAETIVRFHMDKLQARKYRELAETLGLEMDDLEAEIEIIKSLDPRPGRRYSTESSTYVVPDVYVVKVDEDYQIVLNEDGLPRLRISPVYRRMVQRGAADAGKDAKEYVKNKLRAAFRLIKSLEERQRTIYKVATSIVTFQREFLDHGIERLKPLVLKDVAEDIGMHESTVSRVVNNKYMHTHRGLFEMRFFFHSGITATGGGANVSSLTVKDKIRKLIQGEDDRHPFSDSAIVKLLHADGLKIARRTVAKYREELKIPASSHRKQAFR